MSLKNHIRDLPEAHRRRLKSLLAVIPPGMRQSRTYRRWGGFLREAQYWPAERIEAWQLEQLRAIVQHAISKTEGYR